ncbi:MAG: DUF2087 domain-containing protein [Spirochaetes bacterium]|nr:DUF2087 domain-containing protein [Spirochaetota bacterium]
MDLLQKKIIDQNGIIIRWPKKKEEKLEVLHYIQSKFEKGHDYTEAEVNAIIMNYHSFGDYALLRRELYDNYLLNRTADGKKYWVEETDRRTIAST